jgi:hypothetical protein
MADIPAAAFSEWTDEEIDKFMRVVMTKVNGRYPAGTTLEEAMQIHKEISGKDASPSDFVTMCDVCMEAIPGAVPFSESTHTCASCGGGYDLCARCVADGSVDTAKCPPGYGCGDGATKKGEFREQVAASILSCVQEHVKPRPFTKEDLIAWAERARVSLSFPAAV